VKPSICSNRKSNHDKSSSSSFYWKTDHKGPLNKLNPNKVTWFQIKSSSSQIESPQVIQS